MADEYDGIIEVELDRDEVRHLLTHGQARVNKEVGPLRVDIKTKTKLRATVLLDDRDADPEELTDE